MRSVHRLREFAATSAIAIAVAVVVAAAKPCRGATIPSVFTKIADFDTDIPGGTGQFTGFGLPAIEGGTVVFRGLGPGNQHGIYRWDAGALSLVADLTTAAPDQGSLFANFFDPTIDDGVVAFTATTSTAGRQGTYAANGVLAALVSFGDTMPENPPLGNTFTSFNDLPSKDGENFAIQGNGTSARAGIYKDIGGGLELVADNTTQIPGDTEDFGTFISNPKIGGDAVAFRSRRSFPTRDGIYTDVSGTLETVASMATPIPGGTGTFVAFSADPGFDQGRIAFQGQGGSGQTGIYTAMGAGAIELVADRGTPMPDSEDDFWTFPTAEVSVSGNAITFTGQALSGLRGVYTTVDGPVRRIIDTTQLLDGAALFAFELGRDGFEGATIVFSVTYPDFKKAIYVASNGPVGVSSGVAGTARIEMTAAPNPFRSVVRIAGSLGENAAAGWVLAEVFDVSGRRVDSRTIRAVDGRAHFDWTGRDASGARMPAGMYFVRFVSDGAAAVRPVVLVK